MTFTKEEIETALTWHRRTNKNYVEGREVLYNAGDRTGFHGSYDGICEHILRLTIEELGFKLDA